MTDWGNEAHDKLVDSLQAERNRLARRLEECEEVLSVTAARADREEKERQAWQLKCGSLETQRDSLQTELDDLDRRRIALETQAAELTQRLDRGIEKCDDFIDVAEAMAPEAVSAVRRIKSRLEGKPVPEETRKRLADLAGEKGGAKNA